MENLTVQKIDIANQCRIGRITDLVWLTFDPCCSSLIYGLVINDDNKELSIVKGNLRINYVTVCKTFALTLDNSSNNYSQIHLTNTVYLNLETSDSLAVYFTVLKNGLLYPNLIFINIQTSLCKIYKYSTTTTTNTNSSEKNRLNFFDDCYEKPKLIAAYKITHSSTQGWYLGAFVNYGRDRKFRLNKIIFDRVDNSFSCQPMFANTEEEEVGFEGETPVNYFLIEDIIYFTFFNTNSVRVFDASKKQWLNKIETPSMFRVCRSVERTKSGLIFVFNGRQPFYRLIVKQQENKGDDKANDNNITCCWEQLSFSLPTHEAFVRVIIDWNDNVLVSVPFAQRMELFYGCLNYCSSNNITLPVSLRSLAFNKFMQKFTVPEQEQEHFVAGLGLPHNLLRAYFGPLWMLKDRTTERVEV